MTIQFSHKESLDVGCRCQLGEGRPRVLFEPSPNQSLSAGFYNNPPMALFWFSVKSTAFPRRIFWVSDHLAFKKKLTGQAVAANQLAHIINIMHINIWRINNPPPQNARACQRSKMQSISLWGMNSLRGSKDEKTKSGWMMKRGGAYFTSFIFWLFFFCLSMAAAPLNPAWHSLIIWNISARIRGKRGWMGETYERRKRVGANFSFFRCFFFPESNKSF